MEFDLVLVSLPAFTQHCPSLGLSALASYLTEKHYDIICYDFGVSFYKNWLKKFKIRNALVKQLGLSLYPLWGASNWLNFPEILNLTGQYILESLCPVCSKLYHPIFVEFLTQSSYTQKILDSYVDALVKLDSNVYAFSLLLGNAPASLYVLKKIKEKKPDVTIIVGGPEASLHYRAMFYSQLDAIDFTVYHSEGEIPLDRLLAHLQGKISKESVPGILFKNKEGIHKTKHPPFLDLNKLPIPNYELVEIGSKLDNLKSLDILISKGCPYHCTFCNEPLIWGTYRPKNAQKIFEELYYYVTNYGITHFELGDNTFSASPSFLFALERLLKNGIKIKWNGNARVNELNKQKLIQFHNLGLSHCYFGIESGSPKILELMGKRFNLTQASKVLQFCYQQQINLSLYFIVGFPGETQNDFQQTIDFIAAHNKYINDIVVSVFTLMPNTAMFNSKLLNPIQLGPNILNAFTYQTTDGITHKERKKRFLILQQLKNQL